MAAERRVVWERRCKFRYCLCVWEYRDLLPRRAAPGSDYVCIPDADADDRRSAWSLLVGVTDAESSLRVSRLRVARSGRILGRSDAALEPFHDIALANPPGYCFQAGAALAPDGRSLCVLRQNSREQPQGLRLSLTDTEEELPLLPEIEGTLACTPISAAGQIWAMSADLPKDDVESFRVVARRLVGGGGGKRWEHVGGPFTSPLLHNRLPQWRGDLLQGYAVLPDAKLILVSFQQHGLFLTFAPDSGRWTPVCVDTEGETRLKDYLPIYGRGVYIEQDKAVYMLRDNIIYAYKLAYQEQDDDQGTRRQLRLDPPVEIDFVCPFIPGKGYGYLTRLGDGRLMCSVSCGANLARVTTCTSSSPPSTSATRLREGSRCCTPLAAG